MIGNSLRPKWRQMDLILLFVIGLLVVDGKANLSSLGHQFAEIAILLVWLALMWAWLRANAAAISQEQWQRGGKTHRVPLGRITVYRNGAPSEHRAPAIDESASDVQTSTAQQNEAARAQDCWHAAAGIGGVAGQPGADGTLPGEPSERTI